ncbi:MAG TPA: pyridoxamine 5'-phosphate oxidase family protein [Nitriliruptorales bacterium]
MRLVYEPDEQGYLRDRLQSVDPPHGTEGLSLDAAQALLARNHVGRLGFVRYDQPVLLPVNYAIDAQGDVVLRTTRGSKLYVAENEVVPAAFEVDEFDTASGRGITVVVRGPMVAVVDLIEIRRLRDLDLNSFADAVERERWIRILPRSIEGWVFSPSGERAPT